MEKSEKPSIYGLYLAYAAYEVLSEEECKDPNTPRYPPEIARVALYKSSFEQLNAYANTPCPASQMFTANSMEEVHEKVSEFKKNFLDPVWLADNIDFWI